VQDAESYQRVVRTDRAETVVAIREGLADVDAGRVKPARRALKALARKYGILKSDD
jgi:predicted transcriptional regulator